jgi:hypothetical protein
MKQVPMNDNKQKKEGEVFLMHAANELQADTVESLLRSYEIPVLKKRREAGSYLNITTGINIYGVDLYVPARLHKAAIALVKTRKREEDDRDAEFEQEEDAFRRKRLIRIWVIIGIFYVPVLIWVLINALK